jgi:tetratricopeptide (TPR) repeat protein
MTERSIFLAALEIDDAVERSAYLDRACAGDPALRSQVEQLLMAHQGPGRFMERPAAALVAAVDEPICERPGTVIGPYKLLEQIGEGGFGVVFLAEQLQPVRRKVALKVLKPGMDTRQVVARFEAERQALALMDHPNIAQVFDGGATASGRPYFVMELVRGIPLTEFCDRNRLSVRERLELFVGVCQAVQHAHQKGIIHRDLKPSNILVTRHDDKAVPKVIDFGVAKATGQPLTDKTLFTNFAQLIGTPLYMSPEQAGQSGLDIDTRSDIYSLGVLLYELLTGTTPFDQERLRTVGYDELRRIIREEEPAKPSTRISTLGPAAATVSANRQSDPRRLRQLFRGELDWIVMKALEKDRNRRYETASAFAADVQRYLNNEPVLACPPSAWYRFRKFARRNQAALATAAVVALAVLAVVGSLAGSAGWRLREAAERRGRTAEAVEVALKESDEHQRAFRLAEALEAGRKAEAALAAGEGSAALQQRVRERLRDLEMLARVEWIHNQKGMIKEQLVSNLALGEKRPRAKGGQWKPLTDVSIDGELTRAFADYGIPVEELDPREAGERIQARSIAVELAAVLDDWATSRRRTRPKDDTSWRQLLAAARAADPDPWRTQVRDALEKQDRGALEKLADQETALGLPLVSQYRLAEALVQVGSMEKAVAFLRQAQRRRPGEFWFNFYLANTLHWRVENGDLDEALRHYTAALAARPRSPLALMGLAGALRDKGNLDEAIAVYQKVIELDRKHFLAHLNLADALEDKGLFDKAVATYQEAIRIRPEESHAYSNLGAILARQKRFDEAIATLRQAIQLDQGNATAHFNLGTALRKTKRPAEAVRALQEALHLRPDHFLTLICLAEALHENGNRDDARATYQEAFHRRPADANTLLKLGATLRKRGLRDESLTAFREAGRLNPDLADAHASVGDGLLARKQFPEAIEAYRAAIRAKPDYAQAHHNLGLALVASGRIDEAISHYRQALRLRPDSPGYRLSLGTALCDHKRDYDGAIAVFQEAIRLQPDNAVAHDNLGVALSAKRDHDGAIAAFREAIRLNPDNAMSHWKLGSALAAKRQYDDAIAAYRDALRLKPDLFEAQVGLARALVSKRALPEAIAVYQAALHLRPNDAQCQFELADQLAAADQLDEAEAAFARAAALWRKRAAGPAAPLVDRSQLGAVLNNFAMLQMRRKKPAEAAALLEEAVASQKAALEGDPRSPRYRQYLRNHYRNLSDARLALGDHAAAARAAVEPPRLFPDSWEEHLRAVNILVRCARLAQEDAGQPETERRELAQAYTRAVRQHAREAVKRSGDDPNALNRLAWFLAHSPECRAPGLAVELAQQAVELAPQQNGYWATLGAAHYRAGHWKEAVKVLEESMARRKGTDGPEGFFLAMAHWQLGNKTEARQWYKRTAQGMEKNQAGDNELRFFRDEAAQLLGIERKN